MFANPYQEIVGLDVSMDKVARVSIFVHDHSIVIALSPEPLDKRHLDASASVLWTSDSDLIPTSSPEMLLILR
jgi:hypothetical protein